MRSYAVHAVPGLAQTAGYAAAAIGMARPGITNRQVRDLVRLQVRRQEHALTAGRRLHLILDQSVLLRPVGTAPVMAAQLRHLLTLSIHPAVTLQVAELARPRPVLTCPFTILSFPEPASPDAACTTGIGGQVTITTGHSGLQALHAAFSALADNAASTADSATLIKDTTAHWERQAHQER